MADGVRKDEEFSGTREVEERHRVNEANLDAWMRANVEGYQGPLTVLQFKGGQSNPTYQINTPSRSYVMRRRPFGNPISDGRRSSSARSRRRSIRLLSTPISIGAA